MAKRGGRVSAKQSAGHPFRALTEADLEQMAAFVRPHLGNPDFPKLLQDDLIDLGVDEARARELVATFLARVRS